MTSPDRHAFLDAITWALLAELPSDLQVAGDAPTRAARAYVAAALDAAPWHVRLVDRIVRPVLWLWLGLGGTPSGFASFGGPFAGVVRLYRSLALIAYIESPELRSALRGETVAQRQARFRSARARLTRNDL